MNKICLPITHPDQIPAAEASDVDYIEIRLDQMDYQTLQKPVILTGKPSEHPCAYIDIPFPQALHGRKNVIYSYHNFEETPPLDDLYQQMKAAGPAYLKIACKANSGCDTLRLLLLGQKDRNLIAIGMGEIGQPTRLLAPLTYAHNGTPNAPGQLSIEELKIYRYRQLNAETRIYGLIGSPVSQSIGHIYHNQAFGDQNKVYLKFDLKPHELEEAFGYLKQLPVDGLSVTMPLKEAVMPFIDVLHDHSGAINTLKFVEGKIHGYNTDNQAAVSLIPKESKVLILGAGGSARAIGYALKKHGCHVMFYNRTFDKAQKLAEELGCEATTTIPDYDVLINATSVGMFTDESPIAILQPETTVLDLIQKETPLQKMAKSQNCKVISGKEFFILQAQLQQALWSQ